MTTWCPFAKRLGPIFLSFLEDFNERHRHQQPKLRIGILDMETLPTQSLLLNNKSSPQLVFLSEGQIYMKMGSLDKVLSVADLDPLGLAMEEEKWKKEEPRAFAKVTKLKTLEFKLCLRFYRFVIHLPKQVVF